MSALFGPGPAQVFSSSAVWRVMVGSHFRQPLEALGTLLHPPMCPDTMAAQLAVEPGGALRLYAALLRSGSGVLQGLDIEPRARLMFEIHELKEWDKRRQHFLMQR